MSIVSNILAFYKNRMLRAQQTRRRVNEYELSKDAVYELKQVVKAGAIQTEATQRYLLRIHTGLEITWHDIVFYAVVVHGLQPRELIPELRHGSNRFDQDFVRQCRKRRLRVERANR